MLVLWVLLAVVSLYLGLLVWVAWLSVHPPRIPVFCSPGAFGAPQEDVEFESGDLVIRGWWVEAADPKIVAVCLHGYIMNRSELAPVAFRLWQAGISSLLIDFRAHGQSSRARSSLGWRERNDVNAAVEFAKQRMPGAKVVLIGSSMGSASAAFAMADDPNLADALVLDSSYSKLSEAVPGWWRFVGGKAAEIFFFPVMPLCGWMAGVNPYRVDVAAALARIKAPVLVMHGEKDDLALPSAARRNLTALPPDTETVWFAQAGHTEGRWTQPELYWEALSRFIDRLLASHKVGAGGG